MSFPTTPTAGPAEGRKEIRLHGLGPEETMGAVMTFFSTKAHILGVILHPAEDNTQWAQMWVRTEQDVARCLARQEQIKEAGITIVEHTPSPPPAQPHSEPTYSSGAPSFPQGPLPPFPYSRSIPPTYGPGTPVTGMGMGMAIGSGTGSSLGTDANPTLGFSRSGPRLSFPAHSLTERDRFSSAPSAGGGREDDDEGRYEAMLAHGAPAPWLTRERGTRGEGGSLPRNLYIVDLPLDMSETEFRAMYEGFGEVEHCKLLSQLDGMGRRRGFILMATHRNAMGAMRQTNGMVLELDVSWALVQREAKQFTPIFGAMPNRVVHPPTSAPLRRPTNNMLGEFSMDCAVVVENLDPGLFPTATTIRTLFSTFGTISRVHLLDSSASCLSALIQFEHPMSAAVLVRSSGMQLGPRRMTARMLDGMNDAYLPAEHGQRAMTSAYQEDRADVDRELEVAPRSLRWSAPAPTPLHSHNGSSAPFYPFSLPTSHAQQSFFSDSPPSTGNDMRPQSSGLNADVQPFVPTFGNAAAQLHQQNASANAMFMQGKPQVLGNPSWGTFTPPPGMSFLRRLTTPHGATKPVNSLNVSLSRSGDRSSSDGAQADDGFLSRAMGKMGVMGSDGGMSGGAESGGREGVDTRKEGSEGSAGGLSSSTTTSSSGRASGDTGSASGRAECGGAPGSNLKSQGESSNSGSSSDHGASSSSTAVSISCNEGGTKLHGVAAALGAQRLSPLHSRSESRISGGEKSVSEGTVSGGAAAGVGVVGDRWGVGWATGKGMLWCECDLAELDARGHG